MRRLGLGSLKMLLAVTLLITGCHADKVTRVEASRGARSTFRSNPSAQGPFRSVFLKYRADAPTDRLSRVMEIGAPRFAGDVPRVQVIAAYVPPEKIEALGRMPWVEFVSVGTDETHLSALPAASAEQIPWGVAAVGADMVHNFGGEGAGIRVAIIDGHFDCNHSEFQGRIIVGPDFSPDVRPNACFGDSPQHATKVAGIIAAARNGEHVVGVAPAVEFLAIKVCDLNGCPDVAIFQGLAYIVDLVLDPELPEIHAVNMSLGTCGNANIGPFITLELQFLYEAGVPAVVSAGNGILRVVPCAFETPLSTYARLSTTIAVTALDQDLTFHDGFAFGPEMDFAAPHDVLTTRAFGGIEGSGLGASFGTAHVTGTIALLLGTGFTGTFDQIKQRLINSAFDRGPFGRDQHYGYGQISAIRAVSALASISGPGVRESGETGTWQAVVSGGGIPPYSYRWYWDGVLMGTASSLTRSETVIGPHFLELQVIESALGAFLTVEHTVAVTSGGGCIFPPCP